MSGIAGIWYRSDQYIGEDVLARISKALLSSGPGDLGTWQENDVGLVHRIFRTSPESLFEKQPSSSKDDLCIVSDARLDNRSELIKLLDLADTIGIPDCQIILKAYQVWGFECPKHLLGDFAFAIWDKRQELFFCARDPFGVRPFYYYLSNSLFIFGSALDILFSINEVPRLLNEEKIVDFMLEMFEDKARTFYQDVFRLLPAHSMIIRREEGKNLSRFWRFNPDKEIKFSNDKEYADAYEEIFVESIKCRLRSTVPVGSMLSGGLDSSSISCVAGNLLNKENRNLHTFSAVFENVPQSDEREYIKAVLRKGVYEPHFIAGDAVNPITDLLELIPSVCEPYYSPQMFINRALWSAARENNVKVLLDGLMGDNVVSHGYPLLKEMARQWKWLSLYKCFLSLASNHPNPQPALRFMAHAFWEDGIKFNTPDRILQIWRRFRKRNLYQAAIVPDFFNPQFAKRMHVEDRLRSLELKNRSVRMAKQQHFLELEYGLIPTAMELYVSEASKFGIEPRFPFLDRRLVEFCLAIPVEQKLKNGFSRWVAREGLRSYIPEEIRFRSGKADLSWNFMRGLAVDRLKLDEILEKGKTLAADYFRISALQSLGIKLLEGKENPDNGLYVFLAASIITWFAKENVGNQQV